MALPAILIWGFIGPAIVLGKTIKNRENLRNSINLARFGFFTEGYKGQAYYWEFVIMYRKLIILYILVFLSTLD